MVAKTRLSHLNCSLAGALDAVGDWWTLLILRDAFLGSSRFSEFRRSLGAASNILARRLDALVENGLLSRSGPATRPTYHLTDKGRDLFPALVALMQWGDRWIARDGPPMLVVDASGDPLPPLEVWDASGRRVEPSGVRFQPGPGATPETRAFLNYLGQGIGPPASTGVSRNSDHLGEATEQRPPDHPSPA